MCSTALRLRRSVGEAVLKGERKLYAARRDARRRSTGSGHMLRVALCWVRALSEIWKFDW
jgi:hypothetical protein